MNEMKNHRSVKKECILEIDRPQWFEKLPKTHAIDT